MRKRYEKDFNDTPEVERSRFRRALAKRYGTRRDWAAIAEALRKREEGKDAEDSRK